MMRDCNDVGFCLYTVQVLACQIEEKAEPKLDNKTEKPLLFSTKTLKPDAKNRKIRKPQRTPKPKNRSHLAQKPKNRSKKIAKTAKPKIPMSPSGIESLVLCTKETN